jgi:hypothetical protein
MAKITKGTDGTFTEVETTLVDDLMSALASPLKVLEGEPTEFVSPRVAAFAAIGYGLGGVMVGDRWGDSIPVLGGKRF